MRRASMILAALVVIFSLSCISTMAEEAGNTEPYSRLVAELERQREEISALREEVRSLREEIVHLLANQIERQWEEMNNLREMQQHQYNFMQEMLSREHEVRLRQGMEGREREWERERNEPNIEMELRHLQEEVERNPGDPELRVKLGHIYREVDNIDAAFEQYKAAIEIAPDFEPAYGALEELRTQFPDISRKPAEKPLEDAAGKVISANKEEVKLEIFEGDAVTFKVPFVQAEDESWVPNEDFAEFTSSLQPGMRVKILWEETDCCRIIRKIERLEDEE